MHVVNETSLLEFYRRFLQQLRHSGRKVLILALVREADAPEFYEDILRYWSSLHDLTGESVVFAVAAPDTSGRTGSRQYVRGTQDDVHSPLFASAGDVAVESMEPELYAQMAEHRDRLRINSNVDPRFTAGDLARSNTNQIAELRDYLLLKEEDLPCLHLTLLSEPPRQCALPLANFHQFSVYSACREIMIALGGPLRALRDVERRHEEFVVGARQRREGEARAVAAAEQVLNARRNQRNDRVEKAFARLEAQVEGQPYETELRAFVSMCDLGLTDKDAKAKANGIEQTLRSAGRISREISSAMRSLIDTVYDTGHIRNQQRWAASVRSAEEVRRDANARLVEIDKEISAEISAHESQTYRPEREKSENDLAEAFEALKQSKLSLAETRWDAFISYPSPERVIAERLFKGFDRSLRVFLDRYCLRPGDRWRDRIPEVQSQSRCTIPLISASSANAHFQKSEIDRAINLSRGRKHAIYPIRTAKADDMPFGLEQFQAVELDQQNPRNTIKEIERRLAQSAEAAVQPAVAEGAGFSASGPRLKPSLAERIVSIFRRAPR